MIEQDREMKRLRREEEETARRLAEIENKRYEEIRKREQDYRQKREAVIKYAQAKELNETEQCKEVMKNIESKFDRSGEKQRLIIGEKVGRILEHNTDVVEKK